jgi:NO-binding membrane sensor protein with MHYT domain
MVIEAGEVLAEKYEWGLVWVSVLISVMVAYAALDLAGTVTRARGNAQALWLGDGDGNLVDALRGDAGVSVAGGSAV